MNDTTQRSDRHRTPPVTRIAQLFDAQRTAFAAHPYPQARERRQHLDTLKRQLLRYQDVLTRAMSRDFGTRAPAESKMLDILGSTLGINHARSHLRRWMRPSRRSTELLFVSNSLRVHYQPKGVVGIITPWNFPLYLSLGPLAAALAAGNRVMIKMPESTPHTNAALQAMLAAAFDESQVALVGEELLDPNAFTALPFDHIVFTGSPAVGRVVMRTAAANLTPVTLERQIPGAGPARLPAGRCGAAHHPWQGDQLRPDLRVAGLRPGAARARRRLRRCGQGRLRGDVWPLHRRQRRLHQCRQRAPARADARTAR